MSHATSPLSLQTHDVRLLHAMRALPDKALDRARAHVAARLPVRRAELGWTVRGGPADDGCLIGISMSRFRYFSSPLRMPALVYLAATFDGWAFEEARRSHDERAMRSRRVPSSSVERLGRLLDIEYGRRHGIPSRPVVTDRPVRIS